MKKKGFTLVEMIAVILIMALLTLIVLPTIVNQIRSQKENISDAAMQLISNATELYLEEKTSEYSMRHGETYCISLETLANEGKLKRPLKDLSTGKDIALNQVVKVIINEYGQGEYTLVNSNQCKTELLSTPVWQEKSFENNNVVLNYNLDREGTVTETKCYYGKTDDNIINLGNNEGSKCIYPIEAAYAKVCTVNSSGIESCSETKKLADYLILDGKELVEFDTYLADISHNDGFITLNIDAGSNRRGMYTPNPIDLTDYAYMYVDLDGVLTVLATQTTTVNPSLTAGLFEGEPNLLNNNSVGMGVTGTILGKNGVIGEYTASKPRKIYPIDIVSKSGLGYFEIKRNKCGQTTVTSNIYNVWLQLSE